MENNLSCPNCGAELVGAYCHSCGQRQHRHYKLGTFIKESVHEYLGFDGKLYRTVKTILLKPGQLTRDHYDGIRGRYIKPFQLFLVSYVIFWFAAVSQGIYDFTLYEYFNWSPPSTELVESLVRGTVAERQMDIKVYEREFNTNSDTMRKGLIIFLVPILALVSWLINFKQQKYYIQHLILAIHFFTFYWFYVAFFNYPIVILVETFGLWADDVLAYVNSIVIGSYLFFSFRRIEKTSLLQIIIKTILLTIAIRYLLISYRVMLFFSTYFIT